MHLLPSILVSLLAASSAASASPAPAADGAIQLEARQNTISKPFADGYLCGDCVLDSDFSSKALLKCECPRSTIFPDINYCIENDHGSLTWYRPKGDFTGKGGCTDLVLKDGHILEAQCPLDPADPNSATGPASLDLRDGIQQTEGTTMGGLRCVKPMFPKVRRTPRVRRS
ncbi:hypothetical protein B0H66DRAFT_626797 [Apodospora peruviana]|uniref:Cyanovirin-N domain-containing protein n=1 Tax=Apodospora peruviana TaxID=516989 RepID=A0AAE0M2M1_9PEZI|nr:hypothetical protein B0H66DRAFT_626797 [Apodospora peruviana]